MAVDPNGDSNPADHVSVISMSLGSDYASPQDGACKHEADERELPEFHADFMNGLLNISAGS